MKKAQDEQGLVEAEEEPDFMEEEPLKVRLELDTILDKDKTDNFQMSITTIESRNAKRYNHVICWAPHHLARGPLSLKCGDGLEEDLKVASATSRSPPTQDLK